MTGCVAEPVSAVVRPELPPPDTTVYFHPVQSHPAPSPEEQDRDKYECNVGAVQQSGFDLSLANIPPHQRVRVVAGGPAPGTGVALGAVMGAVIGAAVSDRWHTGSGALFGALGVPPEDATSRRANYFRAEAACLDARGYSVR